MGLRITKLSYKNFRNYESFSLNDIGDLTLLVGPNAVGKTNVLEGIDLLTSATSFRSANIDQLIHENAPFARLQMKSTDGNRLLETTLLLEKGKRTYEINGKTKQITEIKGLLPAISFTPEDLAIAKKSSSTRRDAIDEIGMQLVKNYYIIRRDYEKVVRYKNRMLKEEQPRSLVESINDQLIVCGASLFCYRVSLFNKLISQIKEVYCAISEGKEEFSATYLSSWDYLDEKQKIPIDELISFSKQDVAEHLEHALYQHKDEEYSRKRALVGPHNDKIELFLSNRNVSHFASQGQQRSVVLAWKIGAVRLVQQIMGTNPVLLLDDVMSELDERRRSMLVEFVSGNTQTFITTTTLASLDERLLDGAQIVNLPFDADQVR